MSNEEKTHDPEGPNLWSRIRKGLSEHGIYVGINEIDDLGDVTLKDFDLSDLDNLRFQVGGANGGIRVVRVPPDETPDGRDDDDRVLPVSLDEETWHGLEAWVAVGAFGSRSKAAAHFLRLGLEARRDELESLEEARRDLEDAKERLKRKVGEIFEPEKVS